MHRGVRRVLRIILIIILIIKFRLLSGVRRRRRQKQTCQGYRRRRLGGWIAFARAPIVLHCVRRGDVTSRGRPRWLHTFVVVVVLLLRVYTILRRWCAGVGYRESFLLLLQWLLLLLSSSVPVEYILHNSNYSNIAGVVRRREQNDYYDFQGTIKTTVLYITGKRQNINNALRHGGMLRERRGDLRGVKHCRRIIALQLY